MVASLELLTLCVNHLRPQTETMTSPNNSVNTSVLRELGLLKSFNRLLFHSKCHVVAWESQGGKRCCILSTECLAIYVPIELQWE